jgi:hypothetical protein
MIGMVETSHEVATAALSRVGKLVFRMISSNDVSYRRAVLPALDRRESHRYSNFSSLQAILLGSVDKPDPKPNAGEQEKAGKATFGLITARGDTGLFFRMADATLDPGSYRVERLVNAMMHLPIAFLQKRTSLLF